MKSKDYEKFGYDSWERNFYNAKRFFGTKGNINTKSRLKDKWFKDFKKDLLEIEKFWKKTLGN